MPLAVYSQSFCKVLKGSRHFDCHDINDGAHIFQPDDYVKVRFYFKLPYEMSLCPGFFFITHGVL